MARAFASKGQAERNKVQIHQLQSADSRDIVSALSFVRRRKDVDTNRIGLIGHSYGGSLALLVAAHDTKVKAIIVFSAGGYSWDRSPLLRASLITAARQIKAPVMMIHARNDYSLHPGQVLDSVFTGLHVAHELKIYPPSGSSLAEGHGLIFLNTSQWEADVLKQQSTELGESLFGTAISKSLNHREYTEPYAEGHRAILSLDW
jgi:dienelactone hydrolase